MTLALALEVIAGIGAAFTGYLIYMWLHKNNNVKRERGHLEETIVIRRDQSGISGAR